MAFKMCFVAPPWRLAYVIGFQSCPYEMFYFFSYVKASLKEPAGNVCHLLGSDLFGHFRSPRLWDADVGCP
jgi:hypothetical protein